MAEKRRSSSPGDGYLSVNPTEVRVACNLPTHRRNIAMRAGGMDIILYAVAIFVGVPLLVRAAMIVLFPEAER